MKMPVRILLILLCAAMIIALPFTISAPNMLNDVKMDLMNDADDDEEIDFGRLFFSAACAEKAEEVFEDEDLDTGEVSEHSSEHTLPLDFTVPPAPDPELFTEDGYEDETISVKMEHQEMDDGTRMHIAWVKIADASQLRTAVGNPEKLGSTKGKAVSTIAKANNAVVAINGDNYTDNPEWQGYGLSGADAGVVIENNGYLSSPMSGVRIPGHQRFYTLKFKARPADGVESGELLVSMGGNTKTFTISGPEKYYTYVIERPYPDYWSVNNVFYTFKNTYYYNPYGDEEEEDHRVIISDFKVYHGDYSEPQSEPNPKYYPYPTPSWSEDSTFVDYIQNTSFTFGTASDQISLYFGNPQYNDYQYWSYDVKAVYYDGQESDWSNRIDFSLYPWPAYLNDDDDPVNPTVPGDVNGDGLVTSVDITALYNYLLNNDMSDIVNGDQSGDGEITSVDVTVVYNILLGGTPQ